MEYGGSIINSVCFRHQCLGWSLQQCSALLLNAGARLFFFFFAWLCSTRTPNWTLWSFILWCKIRSCVHLILTLNPIKSRCILPCFKYIRVCVLYWGFSPWLACICPCEIDHCSNKLLNQWNSHNGAFRTGGDRPRGAVHLNHYWYESYCRCIMQKNSQPSDEREECNFLHVWSACSAATESVCRPSQHLSSLSVCDTRENASTSISLTQPTPFSVMASLVMNKPWGEARLHFLLDYLSMLYLATVTSLPLALHSS